MSHTIHGYYPRRGYHRRSHISQIATDYRNRGPVIAGTARAKLLQPGVGLTGYAKGTFGRSPMQRSTNFLDLEEYVAHEAARRIQNMLKLNVIRKRRHDLAFKLHVKKTNLKGKKTAKPFKKFLRSYGRSPFQSKGRH